MHVEMKIRIREITRQICQQQLGVGIISGVLSSNHVHMFVNIPPKLSVSEFMRRIKGATSRKIQQEYPVIRKRYWGKSIMVAKNWTAKKAKRDIISKQK